MNQEESAESFFDYLRWVTRKRYEQRYATRPLCSTQQTYKIEKKLGKENKKKKKKKKGKREKKEKK